MLFFLRFRSQLRRTRPDLIADLEEVFAGAAKAAGGKFVSARRMLSASFDDSRIGFTLDIAIALENLNKKFAEARRELSGYALILGRDIPEGEAEHLARELSGGEFTGIWCSREIAGELETFGTFNKPFNSYCELKNVSPPRAQEPLSLYPYRDRIERALAQGGGKNTLLIGPEFMGKRDGLYHYCQSLLGGAPLLSIQFTPGDNSPSCFADALNPGLRAFLAASINKDRLEELDSLQSLIFKERIREELSPYAGFALRRFLKLLLLSYMETLSPRLPQAIIFLENPLEAEGMLVFREVWNSLENRDSFLVFGINSIPPDEGFREYGSLFPRILKFTADDMPGKNKLDIPQAILEPAYALALLGRYFPAWLFPQLFDEAGLNKALPMKAMELLGAEGLVEDNKPQPRISGFIARAEKALGERKETIKEMARGRILDWVNSHRLSPCFRLLKILSDLGGRAGDALILAAIRSDVCSSAFKGIENAIADKSFGPLVGEENAQALIWIFDTLRMLVHGTEQEIRVAFAVPVPELPEKSFVGFKAQIQANLTAFYLGAREKEQASECAKAALRINQGLKDGAIPAFRLFSLENVFKQRFSDALEYISFAVEQAEKSEAPEEILRSSYFASGIYFLYGNLAMAQRFAAKAEETAALLGCSEWGGRALFLRGRLLFEAGNYKEALELFESLIGTMPQGAVEAWAFRTRVFLNVTGASREKTASVPGPSAGRNSDALLFAAEAAFLAGEYREALALAESIIALELQDAGNESFFFTESPDWSSGFAQCEGMFIPPGALRARFARVYKALAQSRLLPSEELSAELRNEMQRLIREEIPADGDPNDAFYYYAWYSILQSTGAPQVDLGTAVSIAFKRLQRRASRIDSAEIRSAYVSNNYWNGALTLAAKEFKLI
ncbi:tetratricopeptide repeat domain protein [Leadbettera azotonutricia ZAS-9]|uniref:Tetratricopeptide repeat domain protein n=2 Tax=Leadbettera azotonutricia TaxID=150829 RepID=F5YAD3_LEAAZ|nr:tetratricopeptide repeat domain protein [Leadbettera azotonutricia ZAS-9]